MSSAMADVKLSLAHIDKKDAQYLHCVLGDKS